MTWRDVPTAVLMFAGLVLLFGCGKQSDETRTDSGGETETIVRAPAEPEGRTPAKGGETETERSAVSLKGVLAVWQAGKQQEAVGQFLAIRWDDPVVFEQTPVLTMSEQQLLSLPTEERTRCTTEIMNLSRELRRLMFFVVAVGEQRAGAGDAQAATEHYEAVRSYGKALAQPGRLQIVRLHGTAAIEYAQKRLDGLP